MQDNYKLLCCRTKKEAITTDRYQHGYCLYSLDYQPPSSGKGTFDPKCSRYCNLKAPVDTTKMYNTYKIKKGLKFAAQFSIQMRDKQAKSVNAFK